MSIDLEYTDEVNAQARGWMLPYVVMRDFLDESIVAGLLDYAVLHQSEFASTQVGSGAVDPSIRVSTGLHELGGYRQLLKAKIFDLIPTLILRLRVNPFEAVKLETELVAHGDGAFYKRHIDTDTAAYYETAKRVRVLSGVYYFNVEPKAFAGGALRLYAIGDTKGENFVDIEPVCNSLIMFPSWAPHEVLPISCPSKRFIDSRFAINCWIHRRKVLKAVKMDV